MAVVAKVAVDSGASSWILTVTRMLAAASAIAAILLPGPPPRWLDGWRFVLALLALWQLPAVYPRLGGDGYEYYVLARSAIFDHDLDLANDFQGLGARAVISPLGEVTSRVPLGMALVLTPAILAAHLGAFLAGLPRDGFSPPYLSAATATSYVMGVGAVALAELIVRRFYGPAVALLSAVAVWWATPLHFYMVANPSMSHAASAFLAGVFVVLWLRARREEGRRLWLLMGVTGTLMTLVRVQDGVLLALPVLDLAFDRRKDSLRLLSAYIAPLAVGALVQSLVWARLWSAGFVGVLTRQGPGFTWSLHWLEVLLSPRHGLFTWTPLYLAAVLGWLLWIRREARLAVFCIVAFVAAVLLNASMGDWWGSDAFGQRRLLGLTPLFALGLGEAVDFARRKPLVPMAVALAGLILWNQQFAYIYNSELVAGKGEAVTLDRLVAAQVDALYRRLLRAEGWPAPLWVLAYDNLKGVWLDEGPRSLRGRLDLGAEPEDLPTLVAEGWYPPQEEGGVTFRQSRARRSILHVPIRTPADFRVVLRARRDIDVPVKVTLEVNGVAVGEAEALPAWSDLAYQVPKERLHPGFNRFDLVYSATPRGQVPEFHGRNAAVSVDALRFERAPRP